jgi:hypothetical protein
LGLHLLRYLFWDAAFGKKDPTFIGIESGLSGFNKFFSGPSTSAGIVDCDPRRMKAYQYAGMPR